MTIDAPWFHVIPTSQNRNGKYHAGKALSYITENNSTALKSSIDEGLDCNKKVQIRGYEQALVTIAAERNKYDCGKYLVFKWFVPLQISYLSSCCLLTLSLKLIDLHVTLNLCSLVTLHDILFFVFFAKCGMFLSCSSHK